MNLRAAQVRIYVDADLLGLGKILRRPPQRRDQPRRPRSCHPRTAAGTLPHHQPRRARHRLDTQVAARGWLILTRDSMIIQNRNEITAVRENNAKMVALNQRDAQTKWGQLEVFMTQWRRIEALTTEPGPFIWRASRTAMTAIALD